MLLQNPLPFGSSQVVGQSANTGAAGVTPLIAFFLVLFVVLLNMLTVSFFDVFALCVFVFPLLSGLGLMAIPVSQSKQVRELFSPFAYIARGAFSETISIMCFLAVTLSAQSLAVVRFHLAAIVALANLVRLDPLVITGIAHTASAQFAGAPAHRANNSFSFTGHLVT